MKLAIVDFNGTMYDPSTNVLVPGAKELLEGLKERQVIMVLVSKAVLGREGLPKQLGIADYFAEILFVMEKTGEQFRKIMEEYQATPEETYVIGDYLPSEIKAGNEAGAFTIHFIGGRRSILPEDDELQRPDVQVELLTDALKYIRQTK